MAQKNTRNQYDEGNQEEWRTNEEKRERGNEWMHTLLNERIGNDIPINKPNKTPIKVIMISLILSFALLVKAL